MKSAALAGAIGAVLFTVMSSNIAQACSVGIAPAIRNADLVIIGEITKVEIAPDEKFNSLIQSAKDLNAHKSKVRDTETVNMKTLTRLHIRVTSTLRGEAADNITAELMGFGPTYDMRKLPIATPALFVIKTRPEQRPLVTGYGCGEIPNIFPLKSEQAEELISEITEGPKSPF